MEPGRALLKPIPEWLVAFRLKSLREPVWVCGRAKKSLRKKGEFLNTGGSDNPEKTEVHFLST